MVLFIIKKNKFNFNLKLTKINFFINIIFKRYLFNQFKEIKMGRMYTKGKGISASTLPFRRNAPKWITMTPSAACELINKLAKKGN